MTPVLCAIHESRRKPGTYVFVPKAAGLASLPEALRQLLGPTRHVADLLLTAERRLARAQAADVLQALAEQGYYLQMPPPPEPWQIQPDDAPAWRRRASETPHE